MADPSPEAEARAALDAAGLLPDAELDIGLVALQFARIDAPDADWRAAAAHLSELAREAVAAATADPLADRGDAPRRVALLAGLLHGHHGYAGDSETYDDPANANLIRVIGRRRGLPVALGILWLHLAEAVGWPAQGLDFPGHFLIGLGGAQGQAVLDPFQGGSLLGAPALRALLKRMQGPQAELQPGMLAGVGKRDVLLRLQNNIKLRRLRAGNLAGALSCAEDMLRLAPGTAPLWREAALMNHRLGQVGAGLLCLERFLGLVPAAGDAAAQARQLAAEWRQLLN
ncbi:transglutaminase-like domain-containing protein [Roseomonas sp. GC11]|uniref:SirB1 family protein n=1 Tax=Roseomonas sp. GC11 TaxID=2950546 RepID=UPI00210D2994|nr:transglutaminase-like domain-containing protein [Roseomonas sp. GC11]MCQ4159442.1 transglutaminase-like domain-containing protein [Roseomonas sp. GC11]